jgi:DNA primase
MIEDHKGDPRWPQNYTLEQIHAIQRKALLLDVAKKYTTFFRVEYTGDAVKNIGLCPYEPDSVGQAFTVDVTKQLYHCFGCGVGGDVFSLVMDMEKVSFDEAMGILDPIPMKKGADGIWAMDVKETEKEKR